MVLALFYSCDDSEHGFVFEDFESQRSVFGLRENETSLRLLACWAA